MSDAFLIVSVKIPLNDTHIRVYEEEVKLPLLRLFSDEPVNFLLDKIRERMGYDDAVEVRCD